MAFPMLNATVIILEIISGVIGVYALLVLYFLIEIRVKRRLSRKKSKPVGFDVKIPLS